MAIDLPLARMTTAEKLRALETIWDDLARQPEQVPAPDWHGDVLLRVAQPSSTKRSSKDLDRFFWIRCWRILSCSNTTPASMCAISAFIDC